MPVQVFVDESAGGGKRRHFVHAGLVSNSERWAAFSDEWRACLAARPKLRYFKMKEAAHLSGEFGRFSGVMRDSKLRDLARIINRYVEFAIYCGIDLAAHSLIWGDTRNVPKPMNDPYFHSFHIIMMGVCFDLWRLGWREKFEVIFDEQVISGPRTRIWYPVLQEILKAREPEESALMPVDPIFRDDREFLPLQAADLYAWCFRRNTDNPENQVFEWLLEELKNVKLSGWSQYYDAERMTAVLNTSKHPDTVKTLPKEAIAIYRKLFG